MVKKDDSITFSCSKEFKKMVDEMVKKSGYTDRSNFLCALLYEIHHSDYSENKGNDLFGYTGKKNVSSLLNKFKKGKVKNGK